jgi:hypothetical protein
MDEALARFRGRKFVEALPRLAIMFERGFQVPVVALLIQLWQ